MTNLPSPVKLFTDANNVESNLLYDNKGDVICTFHRVSRAEKDELIKRINDFPKLVKIVCELIKAKDFIDTDLDSIESHNKDFADSYKELKNFTHNFSRKTISNYK